MDLKAIKVVIGTKVEQGRRTAAYPNFNNLRVVQESGMDWAYYVDANGGGWHYDKCCDHSVERVGSPVGVQHGMLLVPAEFCQQAVQMFPGTVQEIPEPEAEDFYNNHAHAHEPEETISERIVNGIATKTNAGVMMSENDRKALDPDDPTPGITKNRNRFWADYKADRGVNLV